MNSKFLASGEVKCIDDEIPFEIPQGWEWCRISDVCMMQAGKNITADKIFSEQSEVYPYRCVGGNGLRGYVAEFNTEGNHAIVGRQGALCGCLNIETGNFYATEHAVVVSSFGNIHYKFMYWFLMALNLNQLATATAQPGLSVAKVMDSYFPLPPLSEQQRITAKIEELIPIVEKFDKVQTSLDAINNSINDLLKKSILQEAIQGKLVPQITREGTAQELLEQIKQEKYRLVKEGKLKRSALTDSVIYKGDDNKYYERINGQIVEIELPFEYPNNWTVLRLKDVCQLTDGEKRTGKGICLDAKYLRGKSSANVIDKGKFVYAGDNIILVDGENSGEVFSVTQDGYMGSTFKQLWLSSVMWKPYVLAFILFYKAELRNSKEVRQSRTSIKSYSTI
ncbi:restriction endonuclease subunit S [Bacteroides fragilis]|nr:restriction endonuclease subunit S [Bacteroides fragilis]